MPKIVKSISISLEADELLKEQPNQSKAIEDAIVLVYGSKEQKIDIAQHLSKAWITRYNSIEMASNALFTDKRLTATGAAKLHGDLIGLDSPPEQFYFQGKIDKEMAQNYEHRKAILLNFLSDVVRGKMAEKWVFEA
jgi:hypothetical protein